MGFAVIFAWYGGAFFAYIMSVVNVWTIGKTEKRLAKMQTEGDLQKFEKKYVENADLDNNKRLSKGSHDLPDLNLISKEITNNNNKEVSVLQNNILNFFDTILRPVIID